MTGSDVTRVQEVRLKQVPGERPAPADFEVGERDSEPLQDGQVRVQVQMIGLNAGLTHRLGTGVGGSLGPAIDVGDVPRSDAVAVVTESQHPGLPVDQQVVGLLPWATESVVAADELRAIDEDDPVRHLTLLGHVGLTAYVALFTVGRVTADDTVWISAAAGGVGSCAVQLAAAAGATVIASAGDDERLDFLRDDLGVERVLDRRQDLTSQLRDLAPGGLDVYVDAVGGDHLVAALPLMREQGRVVAMGRVGAADHGPVLDDTSLLIGRRLTLTGFSVTDHDDQRADLFDLVQHAEDGGRAWRPAATIHHGIDAVGQTFSDLLAGQVIGRGVVDLRDHDLT